MTGLDKAANIATIKGLTVGVIAVIFFYFLAEKLVKILSGSKKE